MLLNNGCGFSQFRASSPSFIHWRRASIASTDESHTNFYRGSTTQPMIPPNMTITPMIASGIMKIIA
jgi:hypothetical protein